MILRKIGILAFIIILSINATVMMGAVPQRQAGALLLPHIDQHDLAVQSSFQDDQSRVDQEKSSESVRGAPAPTSGLNVISVRRNPDDPGAAATFIVEFQTPNALLASRDFIIFTLDEEFYVPNDLEVNQVSISADAVVLGNGTVPSQSVAPQEVMVNFAGASSNKPEITLVVPDMDSSDGTGSNGIAAGANVTVIFHQAAGITNPTESGKDPFKIRVTNDGIDPGADNDVKVNIVTPSIVELSSTSESRSNVITAVARGFDGGKTVTFWRDADGNGVRDAGETDLCSVRAASDNTASCDFIVQNLPFVAGTGNDCSGTFTDDTLDAGSISGCNYVNASDSDRRTASQRSQDDLNRQIFNLEGLVSVSPGEGNPGDTITVQLKDYPAGALVAVDLAGVSIPTNTDGAAITSEIVPASGEHNFTIKIPNGVASGTQILTVEGQGGAVEDNNIVVGGAMLFPYPATVVPNQRLSLSGAGFTKGGLATINETGDGSSITIGGEVIHPSRINGGAPIKVSNAGNWSAFIDLPVTPATTTGGARKLKVVDSGGRQGIIEISFPQRQITVVPAEGRVNANVLVKGTGFAAQNNHGNSITIRVSYASAGAETSTATATPDYAGNWTAILQVPRDAAIPSTNTITAEVDLFQVSSPDAKSGATLVTTATHQVPRAQITLNRVSGLPGSKVTLIAQGFKQFTPVDTLRVGNVDLTPSPRPSTDGDGSAIFEFMVPGLEVGVQTVQLHVGGITASAGFFVTDSSVADADLANVELALKNASGRLERAFLFNDLSNEWQFFDTRKAFAEANTLSRIPSGAPLWLKVTQNVQFGINGQFFDLTCANRGTDEEDGWNLIVVP